MSVDDLERRLTRVEQALGQIREQRLEDRLDRLSMEVGLVLQTLNQHTRLLTEHTHTLTEHTGMLTEILTLLRERGTNGGRP
jgi:hypothetical protein